jgi:hypothetical protein
MFLFAHPLDPRHPLRHSVLDASLGAELAARTATCAKSISRGAAKAAE